ncbi:MAG TPA: hypothetical protein PKD09_11800 [Aggregatilinea sp.]|uniref:hypothetical protein n=1 Tax=Aggregatilinea sp. TaxID=2806333 RepID=UPI002C593C32|nr:hypothetical protein [Aggregatilinea sp.]HML22325.1 hypothetical protein [Aggregatilinea sp.]
MRFISLLLVLVLAGLAITGFAATSSAAPDDSFLPQRTRVPGGFPTPAMSNQRPTLNTAQLEATAYAAATQASAYQGNAANAQATAQAVLTQIPTLSANSDAAAATLEAYATQMNVNPTQAAATLDAVLAALPDDLSAEDLAALEATLEMWLSMGSVDVSVSGNTLIAAITYSETGINALLDAALQADSSVASEVNVDLIPGGMIADLNGYTLSDGIAGNLRFTVMLSAVDGRIQVDLVAASVNGAPVPPALLDQVEGLLVDSVSDAVSTQIGVSLGVGTYSVDALTITDTTLTAVISIPVETP